MSSAADRRPLGPHKGYKSNPSPRMAENICRAIAMRLLLLTRAVDGRLLRDDISLGFTIPICSVAAQRAPPCLSGTPINLLVVVPKGAKCRSNCCCRARMEPAPWTLFTLGTWLLGRLLCFERVGWYPHNQGLNHRSQSAEVRAARVGPVPKLGNIDPPDPPFCRADEGLSPPHPSRKLDLRQPRLLADFPQATNPCFEFRPVDGFAHDRLEE